MHTLLNILAVAATVLALSRLTTGVWLRNPVSALGVAALFSVLNWSLGWLLRALLLLPTILTLGLLLLFTSLIVNAALLWLTDKILASFQLRSPRALLLSSAAITLVNWLFQVPTYRR